MTERPVPSWSPPRPLRGAALLVCLLAPVGCGKTMTDADCDRVGKHMRSVWDAEATATAPETTPQSTERARLVLKGEGDRMQAEWTAECRRELEGRKVDGQEVECILAAKTIDQIQACAQDKR